MDHIQEEIWLIQQTLQCQPHRSRGSRRQSKHQLLSANEKNRKEKEKKSMVHVGNGWPVLRDTKPGSRFAPQSNLGDEVMALG